MLLDEILIQPLSLGTHQIKLISESFGTTAATPDGKGGQEYVSLVVKADKEDFLRNSFSDRGLFLTAGVPVQKFMRGAAAQLGITQGKLSSILAAMKLTPITITLTETYSPTNGKTYVNIGWDVPVAKAAPTPAELPEDIKLD